MDKQLFDISKKSIEYVKEVTSEFIYRCPICGDSQNSYHGHFYVQKEFPHKYICFKCNTRGNDFRQFILNLNNELNIQDKRFLLRSILSRKVKHSGTKQKIENVYYDTEMGKTLDSYVPTNFEMKVIKEIYKPYLISRIRDKKLLNTLINSKQLIPYYRTSEIKVNDSIPNILLNRIYFKVSSGIYISRIVDKNLEINRIFEKQKYVIYKPKEFDGSIPPYEIKYVTDITKPITLFLVEGIFDAINLNIFLRKSNSDNFIIHTINTKIIKQINLDYIRQNNIFNVVFIPDKDVSLVDVKTSVDKINSIDYNINIFIGLNNSDHKDVGEFESLEEFQQIKIMDQRKFFVKSKIGLDFYSNFCYNGTEIKI
jgi:hypothetical protein